MATIDSDELAAARRKLAESLVPDYDKDTINSALQAIEDWWDSAATKTAASDAIDTATSPTVLSNPVKKKLGAAWMFQKAFREIL